MDRECAVLPPPFPVSASSHHTNSWRVVLMLAYQSFGVVYGDMATSPLYVYKSTLSGNVNLSDNDIEIFGVLSFIFWTLTLVPVVKYVFIVLMANDNGEGGTFALYSLLCRHAKLSLLPNLQAVDEELSTYKIERIPQTRRISMVKSFIEKHQRARVVLLIVVLFGTCMVIGDGVLTPTISVLSAVSGIKVAAKNLGEHPDFLYQSGDIILLYLKESPQRQNLLIQQTKGEGEKKNAESRQGGAQTQKIQE